DVCSSDLGVSGGEGVREITGGRTHDPFGDYYRTTWPRLTAEALRKRIPRPRFHAGATDCVAGVLPNPPFRRSSAYASTRKKSSGGCQMNSAVKMDRKQSMAKIPTVSIRSSVAMKVADRARFRSRV